MLVYFGRDIIRIPEGLVRRSAGAGAATIPDYRLGWYVIIGSIPIGVLGSVQGPHPHRGAQPLGGGHGDAAVLRCHRGGRYFGRRDRHLGQLTWKDGLFVGLAQCLALIPGVSRSGATISAGLVRGLDRPLSAGSGFLLAIRRCSPRSVLAAGCVSIPVSEGMSATGAQLAVSVVITFVIGYAAVAWLLRFSPTTRCTGSSGIASCWR